ncbi:AAA family ATPase [Novosphingobium sp. RD2P27]|uniref:AAA family ATPase n=1 Tax=Novosphingobium kalidii TaxID=3230299 RepID=A0ABV2CZV8_9SPHN
MAKRSNTLPRIAGVGRSASATSGSTRSVGTIAVYSVKGGVGKTTIAANLAWCSAELSGHKTLLWDLDAAGGCGFLYGLEREGSRAAGTVFSRDTAPEKLIRRTAFDGLDILPADESIRALDATLAAIGKRKRLAKLTSELSSHYDRIVLDCPPVLSELSAQVMRAADLVIVPLPPSPLSARALEVVVREVADHAKRHPPILPVLSMLDMRRALHKQAREENPAWPVVPYTSVIEQCAVQQRPVGAIAPESPSAQHFISLWRAIERKLSQVT